MLAGATAGILCVPPPSVLDIGQRPGGCPLPGPRCGCFKCPVLLSFQGFLSALFSRERSGRGNRALFAPSCPQSPANVVLFPPPIPPAAAPAGRGAAERCSQAEGGPFCAPPPGCKCCSSRGSAQGTKLSCTRLPGAVPRPPPLVPLPLSPSPSCRGGEVPSVVLFYFFFLLLTFSKGKLVCVCRSYWSRPALLVLMTGI